MPLEHLFYLWEDFHGVVCDVKGFASGDVIEKKRGLLGSEKGPGGNAGGLRGSRAQKIICLS